METPKEYTKLLKNGIITDKMIDSALWSVNKRAKNWRDNKRKAEGYYSLQNYNTALTKEKAMYARKEKLLSLLKPVCIHKEFAGFKRTRVYDYQEDYKNQFLHHAVHGEIVWINSYLDYDTYSEVSFFDYVDVNEPEYRYYLFYETEKHSYHTPIAEEEVEMNQRKYNVKVIEINELHTKGNDISELISVQFVDKLIALIDTGDYTFTNKFAGNVPVEEGEEESKKHDVENISVKRLWSEIVSQVSFTQEIAKYQYDLSEEERKEIEKDNNLRLQNPKRKKRKCKIYNWNKSLKVKPTAEFIEALQKYDALNCEILKEEMKKYFPNEVNEFVKSGKQTVKKNEYSREYFSKVTAEQHTH